MMLPAAAWVCSILATIAVPAFAKQPSVVVIVIDDLGRANTEPFRPTEAPNPEIVTPNIQALADSGVILNRTYAYSSCTPTRSSLISGRLPLHVFVPGEAGSPTAWNSSNPDFAGSGIPRNMTTLPYYMRQLGYDTAVFGKWDAGFASVAQTPQARGFQRSAVYSHHAINYSTPYNATDPVQGLFPGAECSGTVVTDLWADSEPWRAPLNTTAPLWVDDLMATQLLEFVSAYKPGQGSPFFALWTPHVAHAPLQPPQQWFDHFAFIPDLTRRRYHAMVSAIDELIGRLVARLKASGLWEETAVLLVADNGGPVLQCKSWAVDSTYCGGANNWPLKGGKLSFWEGGVRVPGLVSGGAVPLPQRGRALEGYFHVADVLETLRSIGGATGPATDPVAAAAGLAPIDSISQWDYITGNTTTPPRTAVPLSATAYIDGDYKILTGSQPSAFWQGPQYPNATTPNNGSGIEPKTIKEDCGEGGCLFNIAQDPTEHVNLAAAMPDKTASLLQSLRASAASQSPDVTKRGTPQEAACEAAAAAGGFWVPFVDTHWSAQDALDWLDSVHQQAD